MNESYTFLSLNEWSKNDLIWLVLEMQENYNDVIFKEKLNK